MDMQMITATCWNPQGPPWEMTTHVVEIVGVFEVRTLCGDEVPYETNEDGTKGRPAWRTHTADSEQPTCAGCLKWCDWNSITVPPLRLTMSAPDPKVDTVKKAS